ncbi:hypothetical protein [Streptomyces sp. SID13031]|uniref:hypothetical protein n=1 Tax=Streptomyces sp. SID13031 TaxID=2706046 RepID=UPI0013CCEA69|nr:hypothetical protein [Streptomyces sp. SID13031]NEA37214.1 hypothetical protein [Streptomyces sp. SID13031]
MIIGLSWPVLAHVAGWAVAAAKTARNKEQRRVANVVEHAGIIVSGATRLNTMLVEVLKPLQFFEPSEWDTSRRAALVSEIIILPEESVIVPRVRTSSVALETHLAHLVDVDLSRPVGEICASSKRLFRASVVAYDPLVEEDGMLRPLHVDPELLESRSLSLTRDTGAPYGPEWDLGTALPKLLPLIRMADTPGDAVCLRAIAEQLISEMSTDPYGTLIVPELQLSFGHVIAAQQRSFPEMPPPDWVY